MILQIAKGSGVSFLPGEEVFVDPQDLRTNGRVILAGVLLQAAQEVAFYGGSPDALAPAQATPVDAVQVLLIDHLLEAFTGPLERLNARQPLAKPAAALEALALAHFEGKNATPETPVIMANGSPAPTLVPQTRSPALRARQRPGISGADSNRPATSFDLANLVLG